MKKSFKKISGGDEIIYKCAVPTPAIVIGRAKLIEGKTSDDIKACDDKAQGDAAQKTLFLKARSSALHDYDERLKNLDAVPVEIRDEISAMIEAEKMMVIDQGAEKKILKSIEEGHTALYAIKAYFQPIISQLSHAQNEKMTATAKVISDVMNTILMQLSPASVENTIQSLPKESIPVLPSLPVSDLLYFTDQGALKYQAMINSEGSTLDHTNIIAKSLGVSIARIDPKKFSAIKNDDLIIIDGVNQKLFINPDKKTLQTYKRLKDKQNKAQASSLKKSRHTACPVTIDGQTVDVLANISYSSDVYQVNHSGAQGVGLYRTEMALLSSKTQFTTQKWASIFKEVAQKLAQGPLVIRTADIKQDKNIKNLDEAEKKKIISEQIAAALTLDQKSKLDIQVMIPSVKSADELKQYQIMANDIAAQLSLPEKKLGVMVEEPEILDELEDLDAAFFSIGTNDLISHLLGLDRYDEKSQKKIDYTDPDILRSIEKIVKVAEQKNIKVSLCGDLAGNESYFSLLIGLPNSVSAGNVPKIKELCTRIDTAEARSLFETLTQVSYQKERHRLLSWFNERQLGVSEGGKIEDKWIHKPFALKPKP